MSFTYRTVEASFIRQIQGKMVGLPILLLGFPLAGFSPLVRLGSHCIECTNISLSFTSYKIQYLPLYSSTQLSLLLQLRVYFIILNIYRALNLPVSPYTILQETWRHQIAPISVILPICPSFQHWAPYSSVSRVLVVN